MRTDLNAMRMRARYVSTKLAIAAWTAAAIAAPVPAGARPAAPRPVWPAPPESARVEYVQVLRGTRDFGGGLWGGLRRFAGGQGEGGDLVKPTGIAVSADGRRLYVLDAVRNEVACFDFASRRSRSIALDTGPHPARSPFGLALDVDENLYVTDQADASVAVRSRTGAFLRAIGRDTLGRPVGCAVDRERRLLYVADAPQGAGAPHRVAVFDLSGRFVRWIGSRGIGPGQFNYPTYLAVGAAGRLYVVDTLNWRVQVFGPDGVFLAAFGEHSDARGDFDRPKGVALDSFGHIYVADSSWDRVLIFSDAGTPLLDFGGRGEWPGGLQEPTAVAIDPANRIYVADTNGHRVNVYRLVHTPSADSPPPASHP